MQSSRGSRVKLADIAQASGVSLTAVSLALSDKPGISQETRGKVLEVARSLGYRFKIPASTAPTKMLETIGLLVKSHAEDEPHTNQFYSHVITGIEAACRQMGINLMFANLPVDNENCPLGMPSLLEKSDIDAVILTGAFVDEALSKVLQSRSIPAVLIDSYAKEGDYTSIVSDNVAGAFQATEYLIRKGHTHIGFVGGHEYAYPSFRERRRGYLKALAEHGIHDSYFADSAYNRGEVTAAALDLVRKNAQITAMVGMNDDIAIIAMYALIEAGYRVPQEISIIGFDDIYLAESVVPSLTTMRVNKHGMGRFAVQLLLNQLNSLAGGGSVTSVFRPTLVERSSTAQLTRSEQEDGSAPRASLTLAERGKA